MIPRSILPALILAAAAAGVICSHAQSPLTSGTHASDLDALKSHTMGSATSSAGGNMIPNWNFSDPTPLKFYRYDFPHQDQYLDNVKYVKQTNQGGKNCAEIDLPAGIAGNQGGKIETALVPAEPGARYRAEAAVMTYDFSAKIFGECFAPDNRKEDVKGPVTSVNRIPAQDGHGPLIMIYRKPFDDPPGGSKKWDQLKTEFTIPADWQVGGETVKPAFVSIKVVIYGATMNAGKSFATDFKLTKIKDGGATAAPQTSGPASNKKAILR
jgi:hypothetical protein